MYLSLDILFGVIQIFLFSVCGFKNSVVQEQFGIKCSLFYFHGRNVGCFLKLPHLHFAGNSVVEIIL